MRIGILGGGQLARMMALAAYPLNIATRVYEPADESCAAQVTERVQGEYDDLRTLYQFIQGCDAITYEFENVPLETAKWIAERVPVYPPPEALRVCQDRVIEKTFLKEMGFRVPEFRPVDSREDYDSAIAEIGIPFVLKTTRFGYDGKGQMVVRSAEDCDSAWMLLGGRPLILERHMKFEKELSLIAVREGDDIAFYPLITNLHRDGILRRSLADGYRNLEGVETEAHALAKKVMESLDYRGILTFEFFLVDGLLYANEMAPRVHNSGHWTIEGSDCSQFENHIRAVSLLPLGSVRCLRSSIMLNCIGEMPTITDTAPVLGQQVHFHHYGKTVKANRKLGHLTLCGNDVSISEACLKLIDRMDELGITVG